MPESVISIAPFVLILGALGASASFLRAIKKGYIRNNTYKRKFSLEVFGGAATSLGVLSPFADYFDKSNYYCVMAFCIGACWALVIESIRKKVTKIVEVILSVSNDG